MSKTLEELGYEKIVDTESNLIYRKTRAFCDRKINFHKTLKEVEKTTGDYSTGSITMEELKAIYKYCEDNKWI